MALKPVISLDKYCCSLQPGLTTDKLSQSRGGFEGLVDDLPEELNERRAKKFESSWRRGMRKGKG